MQNYNTIFSLSLSRINEIKIRFQPFLKTLLKLPNVISTCLLEHVFNTEKLFYSSVIVTSFSFNFITKQQEKKKKCFVSYHFLFTITATKKKKNI